MKRPKDEPVIVNTMSNVVAAVVAWLGYSDVINPLTLEIVSYVVAAFITLGSSTWARQHVTPLYHLVTSVTGIDTPAKQ